MQSVPLRGHCQGKISVRRFFGFRHTGGRGAHNRPEGEASPPTRFCRPASVPADEFNGAGFPTQRSFVFGPLIHGKQAVGIGRVVITGTAPQAAASRQARSFAPPRWPESSGTAKRPHSSSTTTAGSVALLWQWAQWPAPQCPAAPQTPGIRRGKLLGRPPGQRHPAQPAAADGAGAGLGQLLRQRQPLGRKGRYAQFTVWSPRGIRW